MPRLLPRKKRDPRVPCSLAPSVNGESSRGAVSRVSRGPGAHG